MVSEVQEFKLKTALVCIAKNEDNYIEEWVNYHIKLGFDMIFIYENNWRCKLEHPQITKIPFDGELKQLPVYNHFVQINGNNFDWIGFIDVDEFLDNVIEGNQIIKNKEIKRIILNYSLI